MEHHHRARSVECTVYDPGNDGLAVSVILPRFPKRIKVLVILGLSFEWAWQDTGLGKHRIFGGMLVAFGVGRASWGSRVGISPHELDCLLVGDGFHCWQSPV